MRHRWTIAIAACWMALAAGATPAAGKGLINGSPVSTGVALPGSPYRYVTLNPPGTRSTVVTRVDRRGGRIGRWWALAGRFTVTAPAYDMVGAGLSADERVLVLRQMRWNAMARRTRLAILNTEVHQHYPAAARNGDYSTVSLRGDYGVQAVSPDGGTAFLSRLLSGPPGAVRFTLWALDTASGRLLSRSSIAGNGEILSGLPITRLADRRGRVIYTLYYEPASPGSERRRRVSLLALDTVAPSLHRVELPRLQDFPNPLLLRLRLSASERTLTVVALSSTQHGPRPKPLLRVETRPLGVVHRPRARTHARAQRDTIGRAADGREVRLEQLGDPRLEGRLLVFNCSGEDCASRGIEPLTNGCPDPYSNIYVVPTLHSDPRMAARIERMVEPEATVWLDLPPGNLDHAAEQRLERALVRLGREVARD